MLILKKDWKQLGILNYAVAHTGLSDYEWHIIVCNDINKVRDSRQMQDIFGKFTPDNPVAGLCVSDSGRYEVIIILQQDDLSIPIIAHECMHAVAALMAMHHSAPLNGDTNELYASVMERLMRICIMTSRPVATVKDI